MENEIRFVWYTDRFAEMRASIELLLDSPAKYLDSELTAEPTSGKTLYERYAEFRQAFRADFEVYSHRIPSADYSTDQIGGLRREDLIKLDQDIASLELMLLEGPNRARQ